MAFENISDRIIGLSPYDGSELPTVQFYPHVSGEMDLEESEFQNFLLHKLNEVKKSILIERSRRVKSNG